MSGTEELKEKSINYLSIQSKKLTVFKRSLFAAGALAAIVGVSGCVASEDATVDEKADVMESVDGKTEETVLQSDQESYVKTTTTALSIKNLEKHAFYTTTLTAESKQVKLFVLAADDGETKVILKEGESYAGHEGDEMYEGKVAFYLADSDGDEGYLQNVKNSDVVLNLSEEPFASHELDKSAIFQMTDVVSSENKELTLWTVRSGGLLPVPVDGETAISTATNHMKIVENRYLQTYDYFTTDPNGWAFRTYEWNSKKSELSLYDETELPVDGPFKYEGMEDDIRGFIEKTVDNWERIPEYTYPFPHLTYPEDLLERLKNGYILDKELTLDTSIEAYLKKNPNHLGEYDAEGAWFYAFPDGQSIYFERGVDDIITIELSAGNYTETISELKEILGEPDYDSKDEPASEEEEGLVGTNYDIGDFLIYNFEGYEVQVTYREETVESIRISKNGL
ncbi:DOMON domain-containing protein [Sporosarcina aquimarina]|uniref:DUF4309 domain-containing protein n=1 Tax=Sporosarcina aquimarina TaxID=114975 RepID=A0ABU4G291_9BACL|nr:hypothetical protein [Sporosarcina aquimarina]MDW0109777.1 hypothetical protein [Sporosarcina aquimarina]